MEQVNEDCKQNAGSGEKAVPPVSVGQDTVLRSGDPHHHPHTRVNPTNGGASRSLVPPPSPPHRRHMMGSAPHKVGSPLYNPRMRSYSLGQSPISSYFPPSSPPYTLRSAPVSPISAARASLLTVPRMPFLPPEHSEQRKAMEAAATAERKRAKEMELQEAHLSADEMRAVLKRERHRMGRIAADLAALRATSAQCQLEAEVIEEGRINNLMRRMDDMKAEKGRIIVELENEEEMLTNTLQKKIDELQNKLGSLRDKHLTVAEVLEEQEEMEEEE